jgi:hypothetical protein
MVITDRFGFLNYRRPIDVGDGCVTPLEQFEEGLRFINTYGNRDGYIYPPLVRTVELDAHMQEAGIVPNSERPASVFELPLSHEVRVSNPVGVDDSRDEDVGLLVHLLAFFFGTRLQFEGWRFDGRVPTSPNSLLYAADVPQHFVSWVYSAWKEWNPDLRRRYINILYMHARSASCLWDWERFMYQYMVFDAIYRFHTVKGGPVLKGHKERLVGMCREFGVREEPDVLAEIYRLRNDLFHEALWHEQTPGRGRIVDHNTEEWLSNLNTRLIVGIAGYRNKFSRSGWWFFGWQNFDKFE